MFKKELVFLMLGRPQGQQVREVDAKKEFRTICFIICASLISRDVNNYVFHLKQMLFDIVNVLTRLKYVFYIIVEGPAEPRAPSTAPAVPRGEPH